MTAFRSQEGVKPRFSRTDRGQDPKVGEGRTERTQPMVFPGKKAADVGIDLATPAVEFTWSRSRSKCMTLIGPPTQRFTRAWRRLKNTTESCVLCPGPIG
jgi:hypothetical protein